MPNLCWNKNLSVMKYLMLLLVLFFFSCGDKQEQQEEPMKPKTGISEEMELSGSYVLKQLRKKDVASEDITMRMDEKRNEVMGNAGCNRFSARYERNGNEIVFQQPVSTKMFCEGKMEREQEIMDLFSEIAEVKEQGNNLIFISKSGETLITIEKTTNRE